MVKQWQIKLNLNIYVKYLVKFEKIKIKFTIEAIHD
jgi:hypothetical protein